MTYWLDDLQYEWVSGILWIQHKNWKNDLLTDLLTGRQLTDLLTYWLVDLQYDRVSGILWIQLKSWKNWPTYWHPMNPTEKLKKLTDLLPYWLAWLTDLLTYWLVDLQYDRVSGILWLTYWLVDWPTTNWINDLMTGRLAIWASKLNPLNPTDKLKTSLTYWWASE